MERCFSCQNILPRTVDRCPVCGHDNASLAPEDLDVPTVPQGQDFLAAVSTERPAPKAVPAGVRSRPAHAKKAARESQDPVLEERKESVRRRTSDFELPGKAEQTRSVAAFSSRLTSDIKLGPRATHSAIVMAAIVIAVTALGAGTALGYRRSDAPAAIAMSSLEIPVGSAASELLITDRVEGFDPAMMALISEPDACGGPLALTGVVIEGGTILAPLTDAEVAGSPTISANDTETPGQLLGVSNPNDLAVIRPTDRLTNRIQLATLTTIRVGTPASIVEIEGDDVTLRPGVVTSFGTREGSVYDFNVSTTFTDEGDAVSQAFPRGTFVLSASGDLLGMADNGGSFVTATRIAATVAQIQANPSFPQPVCR